MRKYYHATTEENFKSIMFEDEKIRTSIEGMVYVCEDPKDCLKFSILRNFNNQTLYTIGINVPDNIEVIETFDHNYNFFKCRCFGINSEVPIDWIDMKDIFMYNI